VVREFIIADQAAWCARAGWARPTRWLQAFWQELRGRTRVTIDHPDLPDALKDIASGAVQIIWQAAHAAGPSVTASGLLPQRRGAELGRAGRDARLAAAGGQCGAVGGVFPGWIAP